MAEYTLTDEEWAEALRAAFDASNRMRFEEGKPELAEQAGLDAGRAKAEEIARRRLGL